MFATNQCSRFVGMNSETQEPTVGFRVASYKEGNVSVGPIQDLKHINDTMKQVAKVSDSVVTYTLGVIEQCIHIATHG